MSHPPLLSPDQLAERRRSARRQRRARRAVALGTLAVVVGIAIGIGLLDGGSTTSPSGALGGEPDLAATTPKESPKARAARLDSQAVARTAVRMPYVAVAGRRTREIALTFDDGPGPYTLRIVRVLRRHRTPATFFQVGFSEHWFTAAERAEIRDGRFVLANHTQSHAHLERLSGEEQAAQIDQQTAVITSAGGRRPELFRPPYGTFNRDTVALLQARKMLMVLWTIDSQDYLRPGADVIAQRVLSQARPGAIVLMHDAGGDRSQTIAALPKIIKGLRRKGYKLVTVPRLLRDNPPPLRQPRPSGMG
ncbi:MAG: polysaccharide deacetylase family protein [Solirubrobacterales bacterium]